MSTVAIAEAPALPYFIPGRLLDASDLAELLKVSEHTIRYWRLKGRLPEPLKIGDCVRWDPRDIAAYLAKLRPQAAVVEA
jgi:predicted DNA-binding transcriptional regulator AlpA